MVELMPVRFARVTVRRTHRPVRAANRCRRAMRHHQCGGRGQIVPWNLISCSLLERELRRACLLGLPQAARTTRRAIKRAGRGGSAMTDLRGR